MTPMQKAAMQSQCYLAVETMNPRLSFSFGKYTLLVSINSGYE